MHLKYLAAQLFRMSFQVYKESGQVSNFSFTDISILAYLALRNGDVPTSSPAVLSSSLTLLSYPQTNVLSSALHLFLVGLRGGDGDAEGSFSSSATWLPSLPRAAQV